MMIISFQFHLLTVQLRQSNDTLLTALEKHRIASNTTVSCIITDIIHVNSCTYISIMSVDTVTYFA